MQVAKFYKSLPVASDMTYEKVVSDTWKKWLYIW